jgi:hypothetical protein
MHTYHHNLSALGASRSRLRRTLLALGIALCATIALALGGAGAAHAAGPNVLYQFQEKEYPTWLFSATQVCAHNAGASTARVRVRPAYSLAAKYDDINVSPYGMNCISRWWFGNIINVTNLTSPPVIVYTR